MMKDHNRGVFIIAASRIGEHRKTSKRVVSRSTILKHAAWCIRITLLIFCASYTASAQTRRVPLAETDEQLWHETQLLVALSKETDLVFTGHLRFGRDLTHFVDERAGVAISYRLNRYLTLSPGYLHRWAQPGKGYSEREHRFSFAGTVRVPFKTLTITDRNTFERRVRDPQIDATRYRNRLMVEYPIEAGRINLRLFVSDEVFYDWGADAWTRNRFAVGASKTLSKRVTGELYYMRQNDGRSRPGDLNIIGTALRIRLK